MHTLKSRFGNYPIRVATVAGVWILMATLWNSRAVTDGPVLCWFRLLTGYPCPFCGTTRAVGALCAGDIHASWLLNPFGSLLFVSVLLWLVVPGWYRAVPSRLNAGMSRVGLLPTYAFVATAFLALWAWNITTRW